MKIFLFTIFFTFSLTVIFSQNDRIETQLQNCTYEQTTDKGKEIKNEIKEFENYLVKRRILNDGTGKSYIKLFESMVKENDIEFDYYYSFKDSIQKIIISDVYKQLDCQIALINSDNYKNTKVYKLQAVIDSIKRSGNIIPSNIASGILSVLDENDFELDYYKIKTLVLLDATNTTSNFTQTLVENEKTNLDKALRIYLNAESEIIVDTKKVNLAELRTIVGKFISKNKSESVFALKNERETTYQTYIEVIGLIKEEIKILREKASQKKFKTGFENLNTDQSSGIMNKYPQKIVEQ